MFQNKQSEATSFFLESRYFYGRPTSTPSTGAYLCFPVPMFPGTDVPRTYVPRYLCSPVPMFPGFCTIIVVISINRLQILPTPWYDSRLGLCLGFRFRVLVRVRVRVRLELQTVFWLWLGCGLGLSLYGQPNPKLALTKTQN